jgi:cyclopropane fatty-acyl-phospholipid synthase-like methyltransferase
MDAALYIDGTYLRLHPTWHAEDSQWKAAQVLTMLRRNGMSVRSVLEVGCGAGEVLAVLQAAMPKNSDFRGYEIAADAYAMCSSRANDQLRFTLQVPGEAIHHRADLVIALDVLEHTEDYFSFLRTLRETAPYCMLHVPLDLSLQSLLFGLPQRVRKTAGHLHYFTAPILTNAVQECGFEIVDAMYTKPAIERPSASLRGKMARYPRQIAAACSEHWAALILGGFSMMVLAKRKEVACA